MEWAEQYLCHPPGTKTAPARDPACNADAHPSSGNGHTLSFSLSDTTAADGNPYGQCRGIPAWIQPGSDCRRGRDCDRWTALVEIVAQKLGLVCLEKNISLQKKGPLKFMGALSS